MRVLILVGAFCAAPAATAAPTVGELRATCARALEQGYAGEAAAMCDWYVAPCGVCDSKGPPAAAWCVPDDVDGATVAALVVEALGTEDEAAPAPAAVEKILRRRYPCDAEE